MSQNSIPIKERDEAGVREALSGLGENVIAQFVALRNFAAAADIGITKLGKACGVPAGTLSQCFNHQYPGDYEAIAERIKGFFYRHEQEAQYKGLHEFVPTKIAQTLWLIADKIRAIRRIQLIESPEQLGKTRAFEQYVERAGDEHAVLIKMPGAAHGVGDFIWELAEGLGIAHTCKFREKCIRIRQSLSNVELVIIDEAHLLWTWPERPVCDFLNYLRTDIHSDGRRGVLLVATQCNMLDRLNRHRRKAGYNIGQLLGRMRADVVRIDPVEDIVPEDVALLIGRYYRPGKATIRTMHDLATREQIGHFGLVVDVLNEAWARAKSKKAELSDELVEAVARETLKTLKENKELYE